MEDCQEKKSSGCGVMVLYNGVFRRRSFWPRRTASSSSLPTPNNNAIAKLPSSNSKRRRAADDLAVIEAVKSSEETPTPKAATKTIVVKNTLNSKQTPPSNQCLVRKATDAISSVSSSSGSGVGTAKPGMVVPAKKVVPKDMTLSGELDSYIPDYRSKVNSSLVRASSSNMMVFGHLGNIRQQGNANSNLNSGNVLDYLPKTASEMATLTTNSKPNNRNVVMGNVLRKGNEKEISKEAPQPVLCRALSKQLSPEELKVIGNEEYKKGNFSEALQYYDRAISIDPDKASYRSNKSAALTGLGRLLEAVDECQEAIRIEPSYSRAHHRLGTLYLRLGDGEKAQHHYKLAGDEADAKEIAQARTLRTHVYKCSEARKLRDWHTMLKEAGRAISAGADSAPQVYSTQAEAQLKLHRHQDADASLSCAPVFDVDACTKFFGAAGNVYILLIRAQVDMAAGRFEEALAAAQQAARLDSTNKEVGVVARRTRAVVQARSRGNELFTACKFVEACAVYGEGLDHDPHNAVLLCNRAACRSKLSQWEKAAEDCTSALNVRPSYSKARLRRADCYAKLERWEASIQDYETVMRETPGNEEVGQALSEARAQLMRQRREDVKHGADVVQFTSNDRFRNIVSSPGTSVVLFCNKSSNSTKQTAAFAQQLSKRYPSVKFLEVDVGDNPHVAKSEGVISLPAFRIYKNGSKVKEIDGTNQELLESTIKYFST